MIRNGPKQTISASSELGLLQIVLQPDTWRYASEDVGTPRGVDCEIPHLLERGTKHSAKAVGLVGLGYYMNIASPLVYFLLGPQQISL